MAEYALLLPLLSTLFCAIGLIVCLLIGFNNGNLSTPPWPYVSDTGASPPESCIFTMLFNWCAFLFFVVSIGYYKYVAQHGHQSSVNKWSVVVSAVAAIGFSLVGCYQYTQILVVHAIGAILAFLGANVYCWMIVYINIKYMRPILAPTWLVYSRTILAILQTISLLIFGVLCLVDYDSNTLYSIMTSFEWAATYLILIFIGLFSYDYRQISDFNYTIKAKNLIQPITETLPMSTSNGQRQQANYKTDL